PSRGARVCGRVRCPAADLEGRALLPAHGPGRRGPHGGPPRGGPGHTRGQEDGGDPLTAAARERALGVDDDAAAVGALRQILGQKGYDVVTAHSAEDALAVLADQRFDLAILDVRMPGMSGYELCRKMRKDARTVDLPVIFLTAKALLMDMAEGQ